jgi:hydroxyacylglutathione hydrolase
MMEENRRGVVLPVVRLFILLVFLAVSQYSLAQVDLENVKWIHGSYDCSVNKDSFAQIVQYDSDTYIIRQNKCLNYEAPFLYLFIGDETALLIDTGAKTDSSFPLHNLIFEILESRLTKSGEPLPLKVIHSHGHGDHKANDFQFLNKPGVELVSADLSSLVQFFHFKNWPNEAVNYNLGNRELTMIPIPGHDKISIAVYDPQTKWLLTGDTIYPGRLYIRDWSAFKESINRISKFCEASTVTYFMGNHIEMSNQLGVDYPTGTTYQPQEHSLPLRVEILTEIQKAVKGFNTTPRRDVHGDFIIEAVD